VVYLYRYGHERERSLTLGFLTSHYFNRWIVEGHKILSDRIINIVLSSANQWNVLLASLENVNILKQHNNVVIYGKELMPQNIGWLTNTKKVFDVFKTYNVDVIHILAYNKVFPLLYNYINFKKCKVIAHLFYHPAAFRDLRYILTKKLIKLKLFDKIIATSKLLKEYLITNLDLAEDYIYFISPPVPEGFFQFDYIASRKFIATVRKKYGLDEGDVVITYIGHIIPQRGIFELIKAFAKALRCNSSLKLTISHSGIIFKDFAVDYLTLLRNALKKYGLQNKVILLGRQDLKTLYTLSDLLFFGFKESFYFTFPPLTVCEAMAAGVPFILRKSPLVKELFDDVPPVPIYNTIDELETILCNLRGQSSTLINASRVLKNLAIKCYHPTNVMTKLRNVYNELVQ
jgi:glycosyltransferase involved in cell wall biosynthesis